MGMSDREKRAELTAASKVVVGVWQATELAVEGFKALGRCKVARFGFVGSDNVVAFVKGAGVGGTMGYAEGVSSGDCGGESDGVADGPFGWITSGFAVSVSSNNGSVTGGGVHARNSVG